MRNDYPDRTAAGIVDTSRSLHARLRSVPLRAVRLGEGFWKPRQEVNVTAGMPRFLRDMEEHGVVDNFRRAAGRKAVPWRPGSYASESDLYKWLEAVGFVLQAQEAPHLREAAEGIIEDIAAAQGPDGYLFLHTSLSSPEGYERFSELERSHELYCAGHLMQAGIAYYRATGEECLLEVGTRFADYLCNEFGPGKREVTDGHPEVEMALIELYRTTGERRYLDLAGFFLSLPQSAGNLPPIAQRPALVGHAVRSGYICCGGADWYAETGDEAMLANLRRLWEDLTQGKLYLTGGVGARHEGEAFGEPYELPNARAYAETCAAIAHAMWAWRMLLITGEARYADALETILYNGFLSGVSLSGDQYFYMNPLASDGGYRRVPWFSCNCCPPNIHRMIASLPGYFFTVSEQGVQVHLYDACEALLTLPDGTTVRLQVRTRYPWEGKVELAVSPDAATEFTISLRVPAWVEKAVAEVNGERPEAGPTPGSYLALRRVWQPGDKITLSLPMEPRLVESHPRVAENRCAVALQRGPLVYCFESTDNPLVLVPDLALAPKEGDTTGGFVAEWQPDLLAGVVILRGPGRAACMACAAETAAPLYRPWGSGPYPARYEQEVTAIPYYAWAHRGDSAMRVWLPLDHERMGVACPHHSPAETRP